MISLKRFARWILRNELRELKRKADARVTEAYLLGQKMHDVEEQNRRIILGSDLDTELDGIIEDKRVTKQG